MNTWRNTTSTIASAVARWAGQHRRVLPMALFVVAAAGIAGWRATHWHWLPPVASMAGFSLICYLVTADLFYDQQPYDLPAAIGTAGAFVWRNCAHFSYPAGAVVAVLAAHRWAWVWLPATAVLLLAAEVGQLVILYVTRRIEDRQARARARRASYALLASWVGAALLAYLSVCALVAPQSSGLDVLRWAIPALLVAEVIDARAAYRTRTWRSW